MDMPLHECFITLEVHCMTVLGIQLLGRPECRRRMLSCRLRDAKGERNGSINISVKVKVPEYLSSNTHCYMTSKSVSAIPIEARILAL